MKQTRPRILGLFQKRIDGDDALLELARLRFKEAGLGIEIYGSEEGELNWLLGFKPEVECPVIVHLPRDVNILKPTDRSRIIHLAHTFADQVDGFVLHDNLEMKSCFSDYQRALTEIDANLKKLPRKVHLFIEYAVGLSPELFLKLQKRIIHLQRVSTCIDTGHLGIYFARKIYKKMHPGQDICSFHPSDPQLPGAIQDIQHAVGNAFPMVQTVVQQLAMLGKPLHFHLHDGHPLSPFSPFGVSDHLSFFQKIPIPFEFKKTNKLPTIFGLHGLASIVEEAMAALAPQHLSFTLEIHNTEERLPLNDTASHLFEHWQIKTNAEKMNHWLSVLLQNYHFLFDKILNGIPEGA